MFNKDLKTFSVKKTIPQEAMPMKQVLKENFERYLAAALTEKYIVEMTDTSYSKKEIKITVYFSRIQMDPNSVNAIIEDIVKLVVSEAKIEGEKLTAENYRKVLAEKIRKYKGEA